MPVPSARPRPVAGSPLPPAPGERLWVLAVPFPERSAAVALGARYDAARRVSVYRGTALPGGLSRYRPEPFSLEAHTAAGSGGEATPVPPATRRLTARPHQVEAAQRIRAAYDAGLPGFALLDDVGTGKTLSALAAIALLARDRPVVRVLVVCPLSVVPHWRATLADQGTEHRPGLATEYLVINYDRLKSLLDPPATAATARRTSTRNRRTARAGTARLDFDVVVFDEAHRLKSYGTRQVSQRAAAAATLAGYARHSPGRDAAGSRPPFVLWLTATAGQHPGELGYLAPLLAHVTGSDVPPPTDFGGWLRAQGHDVTTRPGRRGGAAEWQWNPNPADLERMRSLLFDGPVPAALRRLPDWEHVTRLPLPVELTVEQRRLYEGAWTAFRRELDLARRGRDSRAAFVAQLRFRQKASLLRVSGTVAQTLELLDNDRQVAVSAAFLETVDAITAGLREAGVSVAVMDGRDPTGREEQRLSFQRGAARVVVFTPVEGFSLHAGEQLPDGSLATDAPRVTIVHDPRHSAIESLQVEGRCHRDGQVAPVVWPYAAGTVEQAVTAALLGKITTMRDLTGDDAALGDELAAALETPVDALPDPRLLPGVGPRVAA